MLRTAALRRSFVLNARRSRFSSSVSFVQSSNTTKPCSKVVPVALFTFAAAAAAISQAQQPSETKCDDDSPQIRIQSEYDIQELLGQGAYGSVFQARRKKDGLPVALKAMDKRRTTKDLLAREVDALARLSRNGGHKQVCQLVDTHETPQYYYLAMELMENGEELFEHLIQHGAYSEAQAAVYIRQLAEGLAYMHDMGVTHADLKPENLMLTQCKNQTCATLKVVDFGCSVVFTDEHGKPVIAPHVLPDGGTVAYMSPELLSGDHPSPQADIWAAGCILYIVLTGTHPFDNRGDATDEQIALQVKNVDALDAYVFDDRTSGLSESSIQLLKHLLHPDPKKRMTTDEFRRHVWVQGLTASWEAMSDCHSKLRAFWQKRFRAEILSKYNAKARGGNEDLSEENLRHIFQTIDLDGNGSLDSEEIQAALGALGVNGKDIPKMVESIDLDGNGKVEWDEFRTIMRQTFQDGPGVKIRHGQARFRKELIKQCSSCSDGVQSEETLRNMFDAMDLDHNGVLDPHEIRLVLRASGVDEKTISETVASVDLDHSGTVNWEEFVSIMRRYD